MPRKDKTQIKTAIETQAKTKTKAETQNKTTKGKNNKLQEIEDFEEIDNEDVDSGDIKQTIKNVEKNKTQDTTKSTKNKQASISVSNADEKDSSDISDMADNESLSDAFKYDAAKKSQSNGEEDYDEMDEDEKKEYIQTVVLDRVIKYIKLDDVIKQKQNEHKKEMKAIKDSKEQLEHFLIGYLDKVDEEYIQLGNKSTLIKTEVKTKAPPKMEDISVCLVEGFRKHEIYEDDSEIKRVVKDFIETIDAKREIKTRKYLKRTAGDPGEIVQKGKKGGKKAVKDGDIENDGNDVNNNNDQAPDVVDDNENAFEEVEEPKQKIKKQIVSKVTQKRTR